jgi:hypothetical protein
MINRTRVFITILIFFLICNCGLCQEKSNSIVNLDILDVYIFKFKIESEITSIKYKSCLQKVKNKTVLYKIKVDSVLHNSDTISFSNDELIKLDYALIANKRLQGEFIGAFYPSNSKEYLILNRFLEIDPNTTTIFSQHAIASITCSRKDKVIKAIAKFESK